MKWIVERMLAEGSSAQLSGMSKGGKWCHLLKGDGGSHLGHLWRGWDDWKPPGSRSPSTHDNKVTVEKSSQGIETFGSRVT